MLRIRSLFEVIWVPLQRSYAGARQSQFMRLKCKVVAVFAFKLGMALQWRDGFTNTTITRQGRANT
jgi:hypothetical protein